MQLNYKLIFNKDQLFGLSVISPLPKLIQALPIVTSGAVNSDVMKGPVINNKRHSCLSGNAKDFRCSVPRSRGKTKYCFYYTTPSELKKEKENSETRQNI